MVINVIASPFYMFRAACVAWAGRVIYSRDGIYVVIRIGLFKDIRRIKT